MHKGHITYRGQKKKRFSDLTKKKQSTCFPFSLPFWRSDRNAMRYVNVTTICPTAVLSLVLKRLDAEDVGFLLFSDKIATIIVHWLCKHHLQRFSSKSLPSSTFLMLMLFVFIMKIACFAVLCYAPVSFLFPSFLFYKIFKALNAITAHCVVLQKKELDYMLCKQHVDHLWSVVWCFSFFFFCLSTPFLFVLL